MKSSHPLEWKEVAKRISTATTERTQVAALWSFRRLWDLQEDRQRSLRGYQMWFFGKDGHLLLPDENPPQAACYAVVMDSDNHPAVFLPFLIELRGPRATETLLLPK